MNLDEDVEVACLIEGGGGEKAGSAALEGWGGRGLVFYFLVCRDSIARRPGLGPLCWLVGPL